MMDKWEYCQQHPEECDEDGEYLYSDRPWEEYHGPIRALIPLSYGFFIGGTRSIRMAHT